MVFFSGYLQFPCLIIWRCECTLYKTKKHLQIDEAYHHRTVNMFIVVTINVLQKYIYYAHKGKNVFILIIVAKYLQWLLNVERVRAACELSFFFSLSLFLQQRIIVHFSIIIFLYGLTGATHLLNERVGCGKETHG